MESNKMGMGKFWAWQSRGISVAGNVILFKYMQIYCTDMLGISATLVGTLMLVSKIFDGIAGLFAGYIIDNTKSRWGKARPYELAIIGVWLCTWLLFSCPADKSIYIKCIWIFVLYVAANSIFATLLNTNGTPYMIRAFKTKKEYTELNAYGGIVVSLGSVVVSVSFPIAMAAIATSPAGWSKLIGMYAVPLTVLGLLRFFVVKETIVVDTTTETKVDMKDLFTVLKINKYIYPIAAVSLLTNLLTGINAGSYYFTYIVGDISLLSVLQMLSLPLLGVMFIFPILMRKISLKKIIISGAALGVIGGVIAFLAKESMPLLIVAFMCTGIAALAPAYLINLMLIDCGTYNEWKRDSRMDGIIGAINNFAGKLGNGIGAGMLGILLGVAGYEGALAAQSEGTNLMIRVLYGVIPAVAWILVVITMSFYKLDKQLKIIEKRDVEDSLV